MAIGNINFESRTEEGFGGTYLFSGVDELDATKVLKEVKQAVDDFILANDCNVVQVANSEYEYIYVNPSTLEIFRFYYDIDPYGPSNSEEPLYQRIDRLLSTFFNIENSAALLMKVS